MPMSSVNLRVAPFAITAGLPGLHRIVIEFSETIWLQMMGRMDIMAARIWSSTRSIPFVSALLASVLGTVGPAGTARAADCLTAPDSSASPNGHWYYHTDRTTQQKCWYLRGANGGSQEPDMKTAQSAAAAAPSLGSFKDFMAQRGNANLSDKDVQQLYAEFLEWRRHPGKRDKE
jgi:hypothetical protein